MQLDEYCVVMPWCHILEMLYIQRLYMDLGIFLNILV